jgi:hypothetical protein
VHLAIVVMTLFVLSLGVFQQTCVIRSGLRGNVYAECSWSALPRLR